MNKNLNLKLNDNDFLSLINSNDITGDKELKEELISNAIHEINRSLNISFVYNVEVDLLDFQFKYYKPQFALKQLSFGVVTLGEDVETTLNLYKKKGEKNLCLIIEKGIDILLKRLVDHVNYLICNENYEEFQQGPRKFTCENRDLKNEEKQILGYLKSLKIGIKVEDEELFPHFTKVFIVEWAARKNKTAELKERCDKCGEIDCKLRIKK